MARRHWDFHGSTAVYRLYNAAGELLYVGVTVGTHIRFQQHQQWTWWAEVDDWTTVRYPTRDRALAAERSAIETERPRYNVQYNEGNPDRVPPRLRPNVKPRAECPGCHEPHAYAPARQYTSGGRIYPASITFHNRAVYDDKGNLKKYGRCPGVRRQPIGDVVTVMA